MKTNLRTRAFLLYFLPFAILLGCTFWTIQRFVLSTVRDGLRNSLREGQVSMAKMQAKATLQNSRFLKVAGENTALIAGVELLRTNPHSADARSTVEDQLRDLGEHMGFDLMLVVAPNGAPLAGVVRERSASFPAGQLVPFDPSRLERNSSELLQFDGQIFQVASVPVDVNDENIGLLSLGEFFDLSKLTNLVVLVHDGKVMASNIPNVSIASLENSIAGCNAGAECDLRVNGARWFSLVMQSYGGGYRLLSLQNVDEAVKPIQARLHELFLQIAFVCVLVALLSSLVSSNSIAMPIAAVVSYLRNAARTGQLQTIKVQPSSIEEIQELTQIYNQAAVSVQAASNDLESAYIEFIEALASALDARDQYTAGHSRRVSEISCAMASALRLDERDIERIRIGALLHDIGKIGISDSVLQKPSRLTEEEFAIVKLHPAIGRWILEGVQGFAEYLPAIELHHENWNGSGYPHGLSGDETPIDARIIHVADAYDAMTTDRSYRLGMTHEKAVSNLIENVGIQFDARLVATLTELPREILNRPPAAARDAMARDAILTH